MHFESFTEALDDAREAYVNLKIRMSVIEADGIYTSIPTAGVWEGCKVVAEFADILYVDYLQNIHTAGWGIYITE